MRAYLAGFLWAMFCPLLQAQFSDSFSDGNFHSNPNWIDSDNDFEVKNQKLHTISIKTADTLLLYTRYDALQDAEFGIEIQLEANPSSSNYIDVYIACDTLTPQVTNGYFIRFGNLKDEISFYRCVNTQITELITGTDGELNSTNNHFKIRLLHNDTGLWQLGYTNLKTGKNTWLGKAIDRTFDSLPYAGLRIVQSGTGILGKHWIDNVYSGVAIKDTTAPKMVKLIPHFPDTLEVMFSEPVESTNSTQFQLLGSGNPVAILPNLIQPNRLKLVFANPFQSGFHYHLQNENTADTAGNLSSNHSLSIFIIKPEIPIRGELVFTEVMADPSPPVSILPDAEYIEIKNTGPRYLSLKQCVLSDKTQSIVLPDSIVKPYQYVVFVKNSTLQWPVKNENIILTSTFLSLDNSEDEISLHSPSGERISYLNYSANWHDNDLKKLGGWSLELIDTQLSCIVNHNWGSNALEGGTPGAANSIHKALQVVPKFTANRVYAFNSNHIRVYFSHLPDSLLLSLSQFNIEENQENPIQLISFDPRQNSCDFKLNQPLIPHKVYHLNIDKITSCFGTQSLPVELQFGLGKTSLAKGQLLINEVLFNPYEDDPDYIEIYNASDSILNLTSLLLCNINNQNPENIVSILGSEYSLLPGELALITTASIDISNRYLHHNISRFIEIPTLPSMPNDEGHIALINKSGIILDEFQYNEKMHSPVIVNGDGISLEKINSKVPGSDPQYWTSASATVQFGTPGMQNSQTLLPYKGSLFSAHQNWFTPDNDGNDDLLQVNYKLDEAGYILNTQIYSENGLPVYNWHSNYILGSEGYVVWNGTTPSGIANPGNYVILLEAFHPNGKKYREKMVISVLKK